jgi:mono/diheme cytochrome c family protein
MKLAATFLALLSLTVPSHAASPRACRNTTASRVNRVRLVSTAHSGNHHIAQQQHVITAFAVPVAVPVAPLAAYWYGVSEYASFPGSASQRTAPEALSAEPSRETEPRGSGLQGGAPKPARSLIAQRCTSCHGRTSPKQGLSLVDPLSLSDQDRLRAIRAVVNGDMPPAEGEPLADADRTAILRELMNANDQ